MEDYFEHYKRCNSIGLVRNIRLLFFWLIFSKRERLLIKEGLSYAEGIWFDSYKESGFEKEFMNRKRQEHMYLHGQLENKYSMGTDKVKISLAVVCSIILLMSVACKTAIGAIVGMLIGVLAGPIGVMLGGLIGAIIEGFIKYMLK